MVRARHDGPRLLDALTFLSIVDPTYRRAVDVAAVLHDARHGRPGPLEQFLASVHQSSAAPAEALDQGLHASALCADWRYPWGTSAAPLAGREAALRRAVARLAPRQLYPFDRATAAGTGFVRQCLPWSPTPPTPRATGPLRVPTLLVNGDHDLSTPLEWARKELALAPKREARRRARRRALDTVARGERGRSPGGCGVPARLTISRCERRIRPGAAERHPREQQ